VKRKKNISKLLIVGFFLAIYCNVLFTQLLCNYAHLLDTSQVEHKHSQGHDHHHGNADIPTVEHTDKGNHEHNESKDDNCCNDKTAAFFASQSNPANTSFELKSLYFTALIFVSNLIETNLLSITNSKGYFSYESPPPKIPDIRVFIHSFLI
jgi:hypothetical protein